MGLIGSGLLVSAISRQITYNFAKFEALSHLLLYILQSGYYFLQFQLKTKRYFYRNIKFKNFKGPWKLSNKSIKVKLQWMLLNWQR